MRGLQELRAAAALHRELAEQFRGDLTGLGHLILAQECEESIARLEEENASHND